MSRAYLCIGGPLDGKEVVKPIGVTEFRAAELPDTAKFGAYSDEKAAVEPTSVRVFWYTLRQHGAHGYAWVVQP